MGGRAAVARGALVPARGRRDHRRGRRLPLPPAARLAAARGRGAAALHRPPPARRDVPGRARGARRRAAPLPARVDGRAPRPRPRRAARALGRSSRSRACRSSRSCSARLGRPRARARRDAARRDELDVPLPRRLRPDVQPLPLHRDALVPRAAARARARRPRRVGALGARDPRHRRDAPLRRARARLAGRSSSSRAATGCARRVWAFGAVAVLGIPFWLTDLVLAGRFDAGVAAGSRLDVVDYVWHAAGDFTAGFPVLGRARRRGGAGSWRSPRETRILAACARSSRSPRSSSHAARARPRRGT